MRKYLVVPALAAVALAASTAQAAGGDARPAAAKTVTVLIGDNYFKPGRKLSVSKTQTVLFTWGKNGKGTDVDHNVTTYPKNKGDRLRSGDRAKGVLKHSFAKTTKLYCTIHPTTMVLTVKVN
jgi:plastocyanin